MEGYYNELIAFMQGLLGNTLKDNNYLERAVLTGILRVAKESLFSDLNNLDVCTLFNTKYSEHFGFTEAEVNHLLQQSTLKIPPTDIKNWYNGYLCDKTVLYNPWSIINCLSSEGILRPYWVMTGGTRLVQDLLAKADLESKECFEQMIQGKTVFARVSEHLIFAHLGESQDSLLSLLLAAGYLKALSRELDDGQWRCELAIPNREVRDMFRDSVVSWFTTQGASSQYNGVVAALVEGEPELFEEALQELLNRMISYFDASGNHPEKFYHGFVLGLLVSLTKTHIVESNRESGLGRYDVMVIPHDIQKIGVALEFKVTRKSETLEEFALEALVQIENRHYVATLQQRGITKILMIGLGFRGKSVVLSWKWA